MSETYKDKYTAWLVHEAFKATAKELGIAYEDNIFYKRSLEVFSKAFAHKIHTELTEEDCEQLYKQATCPLGVRSLKVTRRALQDALELRDLSDLTEDLEFLTQLLHDNVSASETAPKTLRRDSGSMGWQLDYKQILHVQKTAKNMYDVSMEDVEAVMLAMVDCGYAKLEDPK